MLPNVRFNVFNEIGTMKDVTLAGRNNKVVEWIYKMEMKRTNINIKITGPYNNTQLLMEVYADALLEKCK